MGNILYSKQRKKNYRYDSYDNSSYKRLLSNSYNNNRVYESSICVEKYTLYKVCLLYTYPSQRDLSTVRMPSSA